MFKEAFIGLHRLAHSAMFSVVATEKPDAPVIDSKLTTALRRSVKLVWKTEFTGNLPITNFTVLVEKGGSENQTRIDVKAGEPPVSAIQTFTVEGLLPYSRYTFSVFATNALGDSDQSTRHEEATLQDSKRNSIFFATVRNP